MLLTQQQQHEERLRSLARTFARANSTLVGRPVTVSVVNNRAVRAPAFSIGDDISINVAYAGKLDTTDDIIKVTGLDFHELAHAEYTPRQGSWLVGRVRQEDLFKVFNMLEDQRIETLLIAKYRSLKPYFIMAVMEYIAKPGSPLDMAHALTYGRKYLPAQIRDYIRERFREQSLLDNIEDVIDEYRTLVFPDDDVRGLELIRTMGRLLRATGQDHVQDPFGHSTSTRPDGGGTDQQARQQQAQRDAQQQVDDESESDDDDDYMPQDSGGFGHDEDDEQDGDSDGTDAGDDSDDDAGAGSSGSDDDDEGDDEASESAGGGDDTDGDDDEADDDADAQGGAGGQSDDADQDSDQGDDSGDEDGDGGTEGDRDADDGDGGDGKAGGSDGDSDSDSDFDGDDDLDGDDDGSGTGNGSDGPRELTDDELRALASDVAKAAAARPDVQRDAQVKKEAIKKTNGDIPTLQTKSFKLHPVSPDYALAAHTFKRELMKLWADADPGWHTHRPSGRVNVQRAMRGGEIDTIFDQWNEGNNEATSLEVVVLSDYSYSMKENMLKNSQALWAIKRGVEAIGGDVTVIGYSDHAFTFYDKNQKAERSKFRAFAHDLGTQPQEAIAQARLIMHYSKKVHRIVLFLTDGDWEWAHPESNEHAIQQLHAHGVMTALAYLGDFDDSDIAEMTENQLIENFHGVQTWASIHDPKGLVTLAKRIVKQAMLQPVR